MRCRPLFVVLCLLSTVLAGCMGQEAPPDPAGEEDGLVESPTGWAVDLTDCQEAGGVAVYGERTYSLGGHDVPEPWVLADIRQELGEPTTGAYGDPILGPAVGHWHMAFVCGGEEPLAFGWVGIQVEPPAWDSGGADRHLLLSGWSLPDEPMREAVHAASGFMPTNTLDATVESLGPETYRAVHDDQTKGVYDNAGPVLPYQTKDPHTVRWWVQVPGGDDHSGHGAARPVWFDVEYRSEVDHRVTGESAAWGCHMGTDMHGPQGGICGPSAMVSYDATEVTLRYGGRADVTLEEAWHH